MTQLKNPFPGIRPFRQSDSENFFGRKHLSEELFSKLERKRFVSIVGASGCGKSSLISAGLLPLLSTKDWDVILSRPQKNPIGNLARELKKLRFENSPSESSPNNADELRAIWERMIPITLNLSSRGLIDTYQQSNSNRKLLVIIDQFEELFQYKAMGIGERENAIKYVTLLMEAASQKEFPLHIIIVMRADFLGHCAQFKGFPEMINEGQFLIPRLTRDQYREAITGPLEQHSIRIAPNVVSQLLNEIEDDPDQLPILQHALMLTFEEWREAGGNDTVIDAKHYNDSGGMARGIDEHCNEILNELAQDGLTRTVRIIFQRLTEINLEGIEIRSPAKVWELVSLTGKDLATVVKVLDAFRKDGRNFITPSIEKTIEEEQVIDLSHECIMRKWTILHQWIKEEEASKLDLLKLLEHYRNFAANERQHLKGLTLSNYLNWPKYVECNQPATIQWAQRYTKEFQNGVEFINQSKKVSDQALRTKNIKRRSLIYGIPFAAVFILTFIYVASINRTHEKIRHAQINSIDSLQNELEIKSSRLDTLENVISTSTDAKKAAALITDNASLKSKNAKIVDSLMMNLKLITQLRLENENLTKLTKDQSLEIQRLKSSVSAIDTKLNSAMDSASRSAADKQRVASKLSTETEELNKMLSDSIKHQKRQIKTERELKDYFASQFAEAVKKNHQLLEELEQRFKNNFNNEPVDPEVANFIKTYIQKNHDRLGTILADIPSQHKITLYAIHGDAAKRREEFTKLLMANGFDGQILSGTVNPSLFPKSGITILAKDEKILDLLKTFVRNAKSKTVDLYEKTPTNVKLEARENSSVIILHD